MKDSNEKESDEETDGDENESEKLLNSKNSCRVAV